MSGKNKILVLVLLGFLLVCVTVFFLHSNNIQILNPKGEIGQKERSLMIKSTLLMLIVVLPVFVLTFFIAWRYREGNIRAKYAPDWDHNVWLESFWWAIPGVIIGILAVITWNSSHQLDPFKSLSANNPPIDIQVVALQYRWLFIYPEQKIATINRVEFPENTPVNFSITADAPMNSFWIPQLGGQVYAMPGMSTQLHLIADSTGEFRGSSANLSGDGFARMTFSARSDNSADFSEWVSSVRQNGGNLDLDTYNKLSRPSMNDSVTYFSSSQPGLYNSVVAKYVGHKNLPSLYHTHLGGG